MAWRRVVVAMLAVGNVSCTAMRGSGGDPAERQAFAMEAETLELAPVSLGGPGPVRVIEFWATWCTACQRSAPKVEGWLAAHPEVQPISVSIDDDLAQLKVYLVDHPRRGQALHFPGGNPAASKAGLKGVPLFVVLDTQGRVVRSIYGVGPELTDLLGEEVERARM